jgi:hypothetical protein
LSLVVVGGDGGSDGIAIPLDHDVSWEARGSLVSWTVADADADEEENTWLTRNKNANTIAAFKEPPAAPSVGFPTCCFPVALLLSSFSNASCWRTLLVTVTLTTTSVRVPG